MKRLICILISISMIACSERLSSIPEEDFSRRVSDHLSSGQVNAFAEDSLGQIWMATSRGLNRYDGKFFHQFFTSADSLSLPDNHINDLCFDRDGNLWVATWGGVARMDGDGHFHRIALSPGENKDASCLVVMPSGDIFAAFEDHISVCRKGMKHFRHVLDVPETYGLSKIYPGPRNSLWVVTLKEISCLDAGNLSIESSFTAPHAVYRSFMTSQGILVLAGDARVSLFDIRNHEFHHADIPLKEVALITELKTEEILLSGSDGTIIYNIGNGTVLQRNQELFPYDFPSFPVKSAMQDSNGLLWLGGKEQGFSVLTSLRSNPYRAKKNILDFFRGKSIASLSADKDGNLWVSTRNRGLYLCQTKEDKVLPIPIDSYLQNTPPGMDYCNRIMVSRDGSLWFCFIGNGLLLNACFQNGHLEPIRLITGLDAPDHLLETGTGEIWVGGGTGKLYRCTSSDLDCFTPFISGQIKLVDGLLEWNDGRILVSSSSGGMYLLDKKGEATLLGNAPYRPPFRNRTGQVLTHVFNEGWFQVSDKGLEKLPYPVIRKPIASVCEDSEGLLWIGTSDGLLRLNPATSQIVSFSAEDGITGYEFSDNCATILPDGYLVFGGPGGLTLFAPLSIAEQRKIPVCFQELRIHNRLVSPGPDAPFGNLMFNSPQIKLSHLQNSFSISYAAIDYLNKNKINYSYRMEGHDPYWIEAGYGMEANYSNLRPGHYTFRVRAEDSAGTFVDSEAAISIRVRANPWQSWWAICLYTLLGLLLIFTGLHQASLKRKRDKEAKELSRLNAMQMSFFSNVAHEFRTPLTMIAGPVSALAASDRIAGQDRKMLSVMQRSVGWMMHLVNQILDFNRLEGDRLELKVSKQDIVPCVRDVLDLFQAQADSKGIGLTDHLGGGFQMWLDRDKLTKILINLLSNAFKFTPSGGQVEVTMDVLSRDRASLLFPLTDADTDNRYVYLSVRDTGPGIPKDQLERIFERFYQLRRGEIALGSGIGLYYSRSLATIHHGYLKAWNRTDGPGGSVFGLLLPVSSYTETEKTSQDSQQELFPVGIVSDSTSESLPGTRRTILVVDDDVDIANYLKVMLQSQYEVRTYFDVDSALEAIGTEAPDVILSDVMMPGKGGFDLCDAIKQNLELCHIPVILVTAMAQVSSQVEGLERGADAYVTKPFDPAYLTALIKSLLENRDKLRSQLTKVANPSEVEETRMSPQDKSFMKELYRLMDEDLSNPELDVTRLTEKMHISRSKFYYKLKGLTGEIPGDFFRTYKLNKAAALLLEGKMNVSEVADQTGFSSLSYFSSSFKKHFGVPPSEYKA